MAKVTLERKESRKPRGHVKKGIGRRKRGNLNAPGSRGISVAGPGQEAQEDQEEADKATDSFTVKFREQRKGKPRYDQDKGETPKCQK